MEKFNSMCLSCGKFNQDCPGTTCKLWTGCVNKVRQDLKCRVKSPQSTDEFLESIFNHADISATHHYADRETTRYYIGTDGFLL